MGFVLVRVRYRRRLWREQHIHLLTVLLAEGNPKCPGQRREPQSKCVGEKRTHVGVRNPETGSRRNLSDVGRRWVLGGEVLVVMDDVWELFEGKVAGGEGGKGDKRVGGRKRRKWMDDEWSGWCRVDAGLKSPPSKPADLAPAGPGRARRWACRRESATNIRHSYLASTGGGDAKWSLPPATDAHQPNQFISHGPGASDRPREQSDAWSSALTG